MMDVRTDYVSGPSSSPPVPSKAPAGAALAALGIVFGDIGTSPLYTLKTVFADAGSHPDRVTILGAFSLIVWTLVVVATIKYVLFAMRIDNDGEGGILALMSLVGIKRQHRPMIVAAGLLGAALLYGDGAITPAISVLSALEGLRLAIPASTPYVLPAAVGVLIILFLAQPLGTTTIGRVFGPVTLTWFGVIAMLGLLGIARCPSVLAGLSPFYAYAYLAHGGFAAFALLGSIFLCVTGAEALYADMGQFGRRPIWVGWFAVVFPALVLNYAGQAAIVLAGAPADGNIFYALCPALLRLPLIFLATVATIIASQAIITGAFSMTRQAIHLGWLPRLDIKQTSEKGHGQIYIGAVNWLLMIVTVGLALGFKTSDNLSAAYGIAVSATMLLTTLLLYMAMREVLDWSPLLAAPVALAFVTVDVAFFGSNLLKLKEGGWVPLLAALIVFTLMRIWHRGIESISAVLSETAEPLDQFFARIEKDGIVRVDGTAIFFSQARETTPPLLAWHVNLNKCLYRQVLICTISTSLVPRLRDAERFAIEANLPAVWRVLATYGFMERTRLDGLVAAMKDVGCDLDPDQVVYYVGHETIVTRRDERRLPIWAECLFAFMERNQAHPVDALGLPNRRLVEIGRRIEL